MENKPEAATKLESVEDRFNCFAEELLEGIEPGVLNWREMTYSLTNSPDNLKAVTRINICDDFISR